MKLIFATLLIVACISSSSAQISHENDIVINEIMADPNPTIALPEWEFIELFNTTDSDIYINRWKLIIGKKEFTFNEDIVIQADDYLILCHEDAFEELSSYGNCQGFSSFQITNSGTTISLIDVNDNLISTVEFDISWHSSTYKEDGGWSLEQIDPYNPCAGKANWKSSDDRNGGSPGKINSVFNDNVIFPKLDHINPISNNEIEVHFNQNMNLENLQNIDNYIIEEFNLHPKETEIIKHKNNYVKLIFDFNFEEYNLYTLNINNLTNCKDIPPESEISMQFGIPSEANRNDILINEILFNPINPGVDYLELYNRSNKVIDLKEIMICNIKYSFPNPPDTILKNICNESRIMLPHSYILLSTDKEIVMKQYDVESNIESDFIDVESLPPFPNEEGHVVICDKSRTTIDEMKYSDKMHYDLLTVTQGVALERISFDKASLDKKNWHSASFNFNYGTPGYKNSMATDINDIINEDEIKIIPEIFSPDGDAHDDICSICYNLDKNGYSINIKIYNSDGLLIRNLLNNNLTNNQGVIFWDGCDDNNSRASPGIYIILTEIFDLEGNVKRIKKVVTVAI